MQDEAAEFWLTLYMSLYKVYTTKSKILYEINC
ncbi:hypothetical protein UNH65_17570 [Chitinophaga sp. 180180018-2]|nr:hypothetical protein [Chitinophaga sp. 212800010-3]